MNLSDGTWLYYVPVIYLAGWAATFITFPIMDRLAMPEATHRIGCITRAVVTLLWPLVFPAQVLCALFEWHQHRQNVRDLHRLHYRLTGKRLPGDKQKYED